MNAGKIVAILCFAGGALFMAKVLSPLSGSGKTAPLPEAGPGQVSHTTTGAFPALLAQDKPVLVDFWAPWCGPCRTQGPLLEQASATLGDRAIVTKVNVDEERPLAAQYGVRSIPTLVILKNGKVVHQFVGVQDPRTLVAAVEAASR